MFPRTKDAAAERFEKEPERFAVFRVGLLDAAADREQFDR